MANPINELRLVLVRKKLSIRYKNKIYIGKDFRVRQRFNCLIRNAVVSIGNNVSFNNDCSITALGEVIIGNDTIFGENVKIYDHNHTFHRDAGLIRSQPMSIGKVVIGNNCWIGSNVTILKGAYIGDNCVIGAGCTIKGKIPSGTLVTIDNILIMEPIT